MKKFVLTIAVISCCVCYVDAQIKFGVKGGLNFESIGQYESIFDKDNKAVGWQAGVLLQAKMPIIGIGIQPELLYSVKKGDSDHSVSYFEIPLNLRYELNLLLIRPFVMAGPYFGYAVDMSGRLFESHEVEKFDWGFGFSGGVEIWKLQFGARYSLGLQDVGIDNVSEKLKNRTFTLSLAFLFGD